MNYISKTVMSAARTCRQYFCPRARPTPAAARALAPSLAPSSAPISAQRLLHMVAFSHRRLLHSHTRLVELLVLSHFVAYNKQQTADNKRTKNKVSGRFRGRF